MSDQKKRISELPESQSTQGLYTIGVNAQNESVKVPLGALLSAKDAQILQNTGQAVFLGTPLINTTDAAITMSGVTVAAKSVYFPASNAVVNGSTSVYHPAAQTVALTAENLSWSLWVVLFDKSNATFEAIPSSQFSGNLNANKYFYAVIRLGRAGASGVGVLRINSFAYKLNGNTEYRNEMPSDLPSTVATHTTTLASHGTAISGLQTDVVAAQHEALLAAGPNRGITFDTATDSSKVTITIKGTVYVNGSGTSYARYNGSTACTLNYSSGSLKYLLWDTSKNEGQGDFVLKASSSVTKLGSTEFLVGIFRLPVGYDLEDNNGIYKLNCSAYTINGIKYINRFAPESWQKKLVSGINIKTVNGQSLLGQGNIPIEGGGAELAPRFHNAPFPRDNEKLRVLCIGNSYTDDMLYFLSALVNDAYTAALAKENLFVARLNHGYTGIGGESGWIAKIKANVTMQNPTYAVPNWKGSAVTDISFPNSQLAEYNGETVQDYIAQPWDVIVVQQVSTSDPDYSSYSGLPEYIRVLRELCTNKDVCIVWNMTWASETSNDWQTRANNARQLAAEYGIDIIIPSGTAIQNGRNLFASYTFTRDTHGHLNKGIGRYTACCAFWETIIAPWSGISILGHPTNVTSANKATGEYDPIDVTDANRLALQLCATSALTNISAVSTIEIPSSTTHPTDTEIGTAFAAQIQKKDFLTPLRAMYIAADPRPASDPDRLKYNAETGYYEMNRLVDITEEQMAAIFAYASAIELYRGTGEINTYTRTLYPMRGGARYYLINNNYFYSGIGIESLQLTSNKTISCANTQAALNYAFWRLPDLRYILDIISCHGGSFGSGCFAQCYSLEYIKLRGLKGDIYFTKCPKLNYESLRYLVDNATNTVAITVTVHATTYGYLTGTIEPTEQVGGTSAEWQQIVTDATAKNISFATA